MENTGLTVLEKPASDATVSLEVMARLKDVKMTVVPMVGKWLFLSYDIPISKEGNEARAKFYIDSKAAGAVQFNESLYFLPWSPEAEHIALELSKNGNVVVLPSEIVDSQQVEMLTKRYDARLLTILKEISTRVDKITKQLEDNHEKRAEKMVVKTWKMIADLEAAIVRRGSNSLFLTLNIIKTRLQRLAV